MNDFDRFIEMMNTFPLDVSTPDVLIGRPIESDGFWTYSIVLEDNYLVSLAWNRHRGFQVTAGYEVGFGASYDEIFGSASAAAERVFDLIKRRGSTDFAGPVGLADLRKLIGISQSELAGRLRMTKGGLSQLERDNDILAMKLGTIQKLITSLGGDLRVSASFPNGDTRELSLP